MKFPEYIENLCADNQIDFIKGDLQFLHQSLTRIPYDLRRSIIHQYIDAWSTAMSECDRPIAAMNVGRRAANIYLRELIDERNSKVL
jgi:hypothetical protein